MKKSKLSIGLVTSFIATMAMSACSTDVTKNSSDILSFQGYNEQDLVVATDDIYEDYRQSATGISKYYDQVMEVLIRNAFMKNQKDSSTLPNVKKNYNQIVNEAKDNVNGAKQTARENAETNGTSYKKEWQAILSEKGVKDEYELLQYYIYQLEKEVIEDWYFDQNEEALKSEYLGVNKLGESTASTKASAQYPYHIRHILVKVEDGGSEFCRGTISSSQAKLLSSTVELLAQGVMTFGEVAEKKSEDSSNTSYGDVGIMTNAASTGSLGMVNEFQLGIYAYDAVKKNKGGAATDAQIDISKALGLYSQPTGSNTVSQTLAARGIVEVPYSVFKELGEVAEYENNQITGLPVEDGKAAIYPRNLLWNKYLNNHSIFVITNGARHLNADITTAGAKDTIDHTSSASYYAGVDASDASIDYTKLAGFKQNENFNGTNEKVLSDEAGNVIIGVRSQFGIHLMIVQKSVYDFANSDVTLNEYYTTAVPGDADYPKDAGGKDKTTYVNFINSVNKSEYNTRAETVRNAIKNFDSTYDYRLYEYLTENRATDFQGSEKSLALLKSIDDYISLKRENNLYSQEEGMEKVWKTYLELLSVQDYYRQTVKNVIPEGCKIAFSSNSLTDAEKAAFEEGGACYVK